MREICERCKYFKTRQGKGSIGECRHNPPVVVPGIQPVTIFPEVAPRMWCGQFDVNLKKYHTDGKKIYTRIDTKQIPVEEDDYEEI